jgi:GNAT superfamily N-acetyltransferase
MTTYEPMTQDDHTAVRGMIHRFYATDPEMGSITDEKITRTFGEFSAHPEKGTILVIREDGERVGYAVLVNFWSNEAGGNILDVDELFVEEAYRGRGIATAFLMHLIQSRMNDCVQIELGVIAGNDRAQELYERIGFTLSTNKRLFYEF